MQITQVGSLRRGAQAGFTLIELIVVIVILGILAATALPKFADLGGDARLAKINGARGAVASAAAMVRAHYIAKGLTGAQTFSLDGISTTTTAAGRLAADDVKKMASLDGFVFDSASGVATITADSDHANCKFTFTESDSSVSAAPTLDNCK